MNKIDLKKELKYLYAPSAKQVEVVEVPEFKFAMIDGEIEPGMRPDTSPAFGEAMEALYGISYTLKFMSKLRADDPIDYSVMALEGLWWVEGGEFDITNPEGWKWRMMIMQPDHISTEMYLEAVQQLKQKKDPPALPRLRFESFREGLSIQIMHVGPYSEELRTIAKMDAFAQEHGYRMHGKHHEIYLGNPMRANPERLKTILRHPVTKEPA